VNSFGKKLEILLFVIKAQLQIIPDFGEIAGAGKYPAAIPVLALPRENQVQPILPRA